jgi:prepilin-type N-terminal cleavage/methylation domain-containing protein
MEKAHSTKGYESPEGGFTLIELSIVLVIIGLVVGGVLVGQDLISAAEVRATISQVEKFNTAVNTFRGKFGYLPGDINAVAAAQFGFAPHGNAYGGQGGDGNGYIEGNGLSFGTTNSIECGEPLMAWVDLSSGAGGNLIEGSFSSVTSSEGSFSGPTPGTDLDLYLPQAKLGRGNYFYIYEGTSVTPTAFVDFAVNYFGLSAVSSISSAQCAIISSANIAVAQAHAMDKKVDDGMPQSGNVMAWYMNGDSDQMWTDGTNASRNYTTTYPATNLGAIPASPTTCYDNGGNGGYSSYSLGQNSGAGPNCALSFRFQ